MDDIERVKGIEAVDKRGAGFAWKALLTGSPPALWVRFFEQRIYFAEMTYSHEIRLVGQTILFRADRAQVPDVIRIIDDAVAHANAEIAKQDQRAANAADQVRAVEQARETDIRRASEEFKDI